MFILRVHSVEAERPATVEEESGFITLTKNSRSDAYPQTNPNPNPNPNSNPRLSERRGVVHLYRNISWSSLPNSASRSTSLFIVAVPNYISSVDLIRFCGSHIEGVSEILFFRNDAMEDRYSVFIKLVDQIAADGFCNSLNGKRFSPSEAEVCHILYILSEEYTECDEIAGTPPTGFTELPTCPICLERLDPDTSGIPSTFCDHSFQCSCTSKWTYLSCQVCRLCQQEDEIPGCNICDTTENLWVCIVCGFLGCGRYKEKHAIKHWKETHHCYSLDLRTQQIWDYVGDSYVHRLNQSKADGKSAEMKTHCISHEGDCDTCECSEDSGISRALFSSKVDAIVSEYNDLLATQLKAQRQCYESLLLEARNKQETSVIEAVEHAIADKAQEIQNDIEKYERERNDVAEVNKKLIMDQKIWKKKAQEIEEREAALLKSKDEMILDLEEQIRDVTVYIRAQRTLKMSDPDGIQGGTILPVPPKESPSPVRRPKKKSGGRRN